MRLPIDAVPDITNVQVQINTQAPGYSPLETEQRITFPVETAMGGLPKLEYTRSLSRYGLSQVTVVFRDGTDIYFARQLVNVTNKDREDRFDGPSLFLLECEQVLKQHVVASRVLTKAHKVREGRL